MSGLARTGRWDWIERPPLWVRATLRVFDAFAAPLRALGVEPSRFRAIVELKLVLDGRRSKAESGGGLAAAALPIAMLIYAVAGFFLGFAALAFREPFAWTIVAEGMCLMLLGIHLLMSFGSLIVDTTDVQVIASRPVRDRTVFAGVLAHTIVYVGLMSASFAIGPTILGAIAFGNPHVLWAFPVAHALSTATLVGLVGLLYAIVLRVFGPVHFQRASLWMQIGVLSLWMAGSQVLPRLDITRQITENVGASSPWLALLPPAHAAGLVDVAIGRARENDWLLAAIAIALPAILAPVALGLASRHFVAALAGQGAAAPVVHRRRWRPSPFSRVGALFTRSRAERAGYDYALHLSRRDRLFLRGVYPGLIMMATMSVALTVPRGVRGEATRHLLAPSLLVFFFLVNVPATLLVAQSSEHAAARWIFDALPLRSRSAVHAGALKALFLATWLPVVGITLVIVVAMGVLSAVDVLLVVELLLVGALGIANFFRLRLAFTEKARVRDRVGDGCLLAIAGMAIGAFFGALFFVLGLHPLAQAAGALVLGLAIVGLYVRLGGVQPAVSRELPAD